MTARVVAFATTGELIPVYAVYPLLFADHGLSTAEISLLFAAWSLSGFLFEVPSGAWADAVDRRLLLVLSGVVLVAAFASWMLWPTFAGFLLGFVLWGLSGAMQSGTFEALLYDELEATGRPHDYARLRGLAHSAGTTAALLAIAAAGWLMPLGGYGLVGWLSVAMACVHTSCALLLPRARPVESAAEPAGYVALLREGVGEAARVGTVRRAVLVAGLMYGLVAVDEFFPLVGAEQGLTTSEVPWMFALLVAGEAVGTALAGHASRLTRDATATSYAVGAVALAAGLLLATWPGYVVAAVGCALLSSAHVVSEARLQDAVQGRARATVTSVAGLTTEVVALATFAGVGLAATTWPVTWAVAAFAVPMLLTAAFARPRRTRRR